MYELVASGLALRAAAERLGLASSTAHRLVLAHTAKAGLPWPPLPAPHPPSEGERCYRARCEGLSWAAVAARELAVLEGRTAPHHMAMTLAKRWATATGAAWPVRKDS